MYFCGNIFIMKVFYKFLLCLHVAFFALSLNARNRVCFDNDWLFILDDKLTINDVQNRTNWRLLNLPHDWAIEGDFHVGNPSGAGGGALPGGVGWYKKSFSIGDEEAKKNHYFIEFDGVYMNSTVWLNGHQLGQRPYGYSSFQYELTPFLKKGENLLVVKVDNSDQPNSRWYSGCGIYRHVWLTKVHKVHVAHWGTYVTANVTPNYRKATFNVQVEVENATHETKVVNYLVDASGRVVGKTKLRNSANGLFSSTLVLAKPHLWTLNTPYIYKVKTEVREGNELVDVYETPTGVRDFRFDAEQGFFLNSEHLIINGVCEHHDLGCFGAAFNEDAMHRKLVKLKDMGVNSIRCSHNPPAPELLDMCDTMGLIVMDESFDMWRRQKTSGDYARFFDEWHEQDLSDLIKRDRNHPSVMIWSIGNEVLEQWSSAEADTLTLEQANLILNAGHDTSTLAKEGELSVQSLLTRHLADIVKKFDKTRPITAGCNEPDPNNHLFKSGVIDVIGFNYHHQWIKDVPKNFPGKPFIMTESVSALQTRGNYMMPSDSIYIAPKEWWMPYTDPSFMCSAYDNMHASWSSTHEETWNVVKHLPFVCGQYIWTGFDYIGEPTPYSFPARSSYFGIIDLAGFPKDIYYMYQSEWTDKPVLHLFPHWNWLPGQTVDMWCYYNQADEVELFVNGKSMGVRKKMNYGEINADSSQMPCSTEFHVAWRVRFEPGEAKVVARKNGKVIGEKVLRTAGTPERIRLTTDYRGKNTTFIFAEVVDRDGNVCPNANHQIFFDTECDGINDCPAEIIGVDNGCQMSMERFKDNKRHTFFGRCLVVVKGKGKLMAKAVDLKPDHIVLE